MSINVTKPKPRPVHHRKRTGQHHTHSKHYVKSYWPYLPILAIVGLGWYVNSLLTPAKAVLGAQTNLTTSALLHATNDDRQANQSLPLTVNPQLQQAAQAKATDMAQQNYWSHTSPDGKQPWSFITQSGYQYQAAGENLAYGFGSANTIMQAWLQSPEHRANLLSDDYSQVGFGVAQANDFQHHGPTSVVVAMYALPTSAGKNAAVTTNASDSGSAPVSRVQTLLRSPLSAFIVGVVATLAVVTVLWRHGHAWRRVLNRGEQFAIDHPVLDIVLVAVIVGTVLLNHTDGFIL